MSAFLIQIEDEFSVIINLNKEDSDDTTVFYFLSVYMGNFFLSWKSFSKTKTLL